MTRRPIAAHLRSTRLWFGVAAVISVVGGAVMAISYHGTGDPPATASASTASREHNVSQAADPTKRVRRQSDWRDAAGAPVRLTIPSLDVRAEVIALDAPDGVFAPPADPSTLGWWQDGAAPGAAHGNALITGHTVHTGGGAFDDIASLRPGDRLRVATVNGRIRYVVRSVVVYSKAELEQRAERVFRQDGPSRLALITCDDWDGAVYQSNAVVFATPV